MTFSARRLLLLLSLFASPAFADGPADNNPDSVRPVPPPGIEVSAGKKAELEKGLTELKAALDGIANDPGAPEIARTHLPDAEICHKAVRDALVHGEFFKPGEIDFASELLRTGKERASQLEQGEAPWLRETGNVLRGYRSRIDGSVQPFGLEIPEHYTFTGQEEWRLDFWFHGRGEKLSEVSFLHQRHRGGGKISPENAIVLHPYGRYSNANKFAGETDLFEALGAAKRDYRIDDNRILVRGFSMGGASCWQFAVHYPGRWAAASPGAGFSETPDFLKTFQGEELNPSWWEKKLWRWYDATDWALNIGSVPTIAYSGENDRQKQAADMMERAAAREGIDLVHLVGPGMGHKYHPDTLAEIESRLGSIAAEGRDPVPETVRFLTYTLRYHRMNWVQVDTLTEHWEPGRIEASLSGHGAVTVDTSGIEAFSLHFPPGQGPFDPVVRPMLVINGEEHEAPSVLSDRSWTVWCRKTGEAWQVSGAAIPAGGGPLHKHHNLQGPIDDAFTDSFLFVAPTGKAQSDRVGEWTRAERTRAVEHWRKQFRGDARVKKDSGVNDGDIADHHLVLWGDPASNRLIARMIGNLPIEWTPGKLTVAGKEYDPKHHTVALIYPNPLNPERYVVLNSGFTYREYDYLNNARQTPKLPDWAVIDLRQPPSSRYPGKIVAAGFFDENWQFKAQPEE